MRGTLIVVSVMLLGCGAKSGLDSSDAATTQPPLDAQTPDVGNPPSDWDLFDVSALAAGTGAFDGVTFDGRYVYFAPMGFGPSSSGSVVARYDTSGAFTDAASWARFDLGLVDLRAKGFAGAVYDGRYVYLVPLGAGGGFGFGLEVGHVVVRYDTRGDFATTKAWSVFDTTRVGASGFCGGTFDGRYVYLVPYGGVWSARSRPVLRG